ncbi:hypothetical protein SmJEL517_g04620 [Synchytrium microbalum]|uniref:G-patch domain-containing protein n=1 Tax=Synchytrium microbalum TaxID=1806994 RepID=A0A507C3W7_9FUNG|nr:uncharacterized protein SmJEL517_g04620 [Synchytrium microbalum]TPX32213.1 hypothetical protein SmJEL517_g04620 [Synchytrium microbalum]
MNSYNDNGEPPIPGFASPVVVSSHPPATTQQQQPANPNPRKRAFNMEESLAKEKKHIPIITTSQSKKMSSHISRWAKIQDEVAATNNTQEEEAETLADNGEDLKEPAPVDLSDEALLKRLPSDASINTEHSDMTLMACLLCQRQFKSLEDLAKHQVKSDLHKKNMTALRTTQITDLRTTLSIQAAAETARYRNRVEARRRKYAPPDYNHNKSRSMVAFPMSGTSGSRAGWKTTSATPIEQPTINGIQQDNAGRRILEKMGWKEGEGLGAKRDGIVQPIEASGYGRGAGLGSLDYPSIGGGDFAESYTDQTKRMARARLDQS